MTRAQLDNLIAQKSAQLDAALMSDSRMAAARIRALNAELAALRSTVPDAPLRPVSELSFDEKVSEASALIRAVPASDYGRDYGGAQARAANVKYAALGGDSRFAELDADPAVHAELMRLFPDTSGGFFGGFFSAVKNFASEAGIKEGLLLAAAAMGANAAGLFGQSATATAQAASIVAPQSLAPAVIDTGVSAAMETAAQLGAAKAAGVASASVAAAEMSVAQWAALSTGEVAAMGNIAQIVSNIPTPKMPSPEPVPPRAPMPDVHPAIDTAIKTATRTASGVATSAAVAKLFPQQGKPAPSMTPAPAAANTGANVGILAAALAAIGLIVSFT